MIRLGIVLPNSLCLFGVLALLLKRTIVLQSTVTPKHAIATGMATCCSTSQLTSLSTTLAMIAEETWYDRMQLWRVKGRYGLKRATSQFLHNETFLKFVLTLSRLAALTRSQLIGDQPSGLTKEQTETMDPSPKTKGLRPYPRQ